MLNISSLNSFNKNLKTVKKRNYDISLLNEVITMLANKEKLPDKYFDHQLTGILSDYKECHIKPDWLLIYRIKGNTLYLVNTGTHSDLFG